MGTLEIHKQARESLAQVRLHEFKSSYKKNSKVIYGFCEGKDDLAFYRGPIESCLKDNWNIQLWDVGGVDNVIELHKKIDWRTYNKSQIIFFIDRDLNEFTGYNLPNKKNIYITDNYSIENDVVNSNTCERVLTEVLGFTRLSLEDKMSILKLFDEEIDKFIDQMVPIMSWIVHWRRNGYKACLDDICMNHLFKIKKATLISTPKPKKYQDIKEYIHSQCNVPVDTSYDPIKGCSEFCEDNKHKKYTRGKYLLWFLSEFCLSIHKDCLTIPALKSITAQPKNSANFSHSCAIVLISSRYRTPRSLSNFLKNTVQIYINKRDAA